MHGPTLLEQAHDTRQMRMVIRAGRHTAKPFDKAPVADHSRRMEIRIQCLCIDTGDPAKIASFWQSALGWRRTSESDDEVVLEPPEGSPEDGVAALPGCQELADRLRV